MCFLYLYFFKDLFLSILKYNIFILDFETYILEYKDKLYDEGMNSMRLYCIKTTKKFYYLVTNRKIFYLYYTIIIFFVYFRFTSQVYK